jgi:hypothetical protein
MRLRCMFHVERRPTLPTLPARCGWTLASGVPRTHPSLGDSLDGFHVKHSASDRPP